MFGLFKSDVSRARRFRLEYEDIRQRYLIKFNDYQRMAFSSSVEILLDQNGERIAVLGRNDAPGWKASGDELLSLARKTNTECTRLPNGIGKEGTAAGIEGLGLLSVWAHAKALHVAESIVLVADIERFLSEIGIEA